MDIGLSRNKVRLSLLATLVAASSALVATPVQAGKAPPTFTNDSIECKTPGGNAIAKFAVEGKGKWVNMDVALVVDGKANPYLPGARYDRSKVIEINTSVGSGVNVAVMATLVDRKGEPFGTADSTVTTNAVDCPAG